MKGGNRLFDCMTVFGVQTHIGFLLCESFINDGTEVDAVITRNDDLLEERMMMIGRNAFLNVHNGFDSDQVKLNSKFIYYCCDHELKEDDLEQLKRSLAFAKERKIPFILVTSYEVLHNDEKIVNEHDKTCEYNVIKELNEQFPYKIVRLPVLDDNKEEIVKTLISYMKEDEYAKIIHIEIKNNE